MTDQTPDVDQDLINKLDALGVTPPVEVPPEDIEAYTLDSDDPVFNFLDLTRSQKKDEVVRTSGNPKDAIGDTKPDLSLVPPAFNLMVSQAMMDGANKYGPYNWRDNPVRGRVYVAAAMRHLAQFLDGEDIDPTSGVFHLGHAGACLAILADAVTVGNLIDDRPKPGKAGEMIRRFGDTKSFKPE